MSYEQFAVGLDEKFGHNLWSEFPEIANKGEYSKFIFDSIQVMSLLTVIIVISFTSILLVYYTFLKACAICNDRLNGTKICSIILVKLEVFRI